MDNIFKEDRFHIRPRFETKTKMTMDELYHSLKARLDMPDVPCSGRLRLGYIALFPNTEDKHYWSPHLSVTIEEVEGEDSRLLRGLYGPSPHVWSMFIFFYAILGLLTMIVIIIGFANRSIGDSGIILWAVPFLIVLIGSIYLVSYFGQKKGHDQLEIIHGFLEKSIGHKIN
ncbi:MAG: hypothetical protein V3V14_13350 [Saprospiraceae bacterium]